MCQPSIPKSLVSAYFDGEVSAEERASVSRAAEKSPAVQQMLDDYAQLSKSLISLKEDVPTPILRDAVMAEIGSAGVPETAPNRVLFPLRRRWARVAGGALAAAAAGLLLMIWPGAPPLDDVAAPPHPAGAPVITARDGNREEIRVASIPEQWFTRQHANDRRTPQPGDVMNYMLEVADETVIIPVTVVDVQRTAGQIRVLLANHGIQPLSNGATTISPTTDASSVAILVESDWEQLPSVMDALDTQGLEVARYVESSPAAKRAILEQHAVEAVAKPAAADARVARAAPAPTEPSPAAAGEAAPATNDSAESLTAVLRGMFFEAPVTDKFVEEIEQRQQALTEDADTSSPAESAVAASQPTDAEPHERAITPAQRFGGPLAREAPARVVFLIKKSGRAP